MVDSNATSGKARRAVAGTKNIHMQKRPSQVKSCTTASWRIVGGISRMDDPISAARWRRPPRSRFARSNAAGSSGGCSLVVITVQSTASRNTTAPAWNAYFTESGTPPAVLQKLHDAFKKGMDDPGFKKSAKDMAVNLEYLSPSAFGKLMAEDHESFGKLVKEIKK